MLSGLKSLLGIKRKTTSTAIQARYDAAMVSDISNENHWGAVDSLSASSANSLEVRTRLRNRSRYEVANNCYAQGMVQTYVLDVLGTTPQLQIRTPDRNLDTLIETAFWSWWQKAGMAAKLKTALHARLVDGEVFLLMHQDPTLTERTGLNVRVYECDQITSSWGTATNPFTHLESDGIEYDQYGNPRSYNVLREHPGSMGTMGMTYESDVVDAPLMIHLYQADRPGQLRGIPKITPALTLYAYLRRYTLACVKAAENAASISVLLETQTMPGGFEPDAINPLEMFDLDRGTGLTLPRGWKASQMRAEHPGATYQMFKKELIQEIARALCLPYGVAAGDHSGYNYASGKLDGMNYDRQIRGERFALETEFLDRVFSTWWELATFNGVIPSGYRQSQPPVPSWRWEGREHQDPAKEANAQSTRLASHTTTLAEEYSRRGMDWEEQLLQRAKELEMLANLGIPNDFGMDANSRGTDAPSEQEDLEELEEQE